MRDFQLRLTLVLSRAAMQSTWADFWTTDGAVDPFRTLVVSCAVSSLALCWVPSVMLRNYSFVDRLWPILPAYYAGVVALFTLGGPPLSPRPLLLFGLVSLWAARLTYNYYRKGGYAWDAEDYRWVYVQRFFDVVPSRFLRTLLWQAFNLSFISIIQNVLLLAIAAPAYATWRLEHDAALLIKDGPADTAQLNRWDALATGLWLLLLTTETIADQQQWRFHQAKARCEVTKVLPNEYPLAEDIQDGFLSHGLFGLSRHPNFACEQSLWWILPLFAYAAAEATGQTLPFPNWYLAVPPFCLTMLFQGSTWLTERITAAKYPAYAAYQRRVARFVPWWAPASRIGSKAKHS
ncbi:hypothetical protein IWQ60_001385 [Tieghemiomyces parasiticus]|uniref:DUF1295 domain-containing protein n=1 Tax=Tieghemiomyces parasiticus TaxID=78921 RepID=A0A9W8AJG9_9FUNG|nr:hypothetical protein IWQ60_001385 [Tieghemiomyces parasiticus]